MVEKLAKLLNQVVVQNQVLVHKRDHLMLVVVEPISKVDLVMAVEVSTAAVVTVVVDVIQTAVTMTMLVDQVDQDMY